MQETSTSPATILQFRQDIEAQFRRHIREALDVALAEELAAALGSDRHERTDRRRGYRNGTVERTLTTSDGTRTVTVPRGRIAGRAGETREFHSQLLPRYARRTREIDEAILGCYLGGVNSRRIRTALKPLLGERHLSKSAVSRIVGRLKALFATWQGRGARAADVLRLPCGDVEVDPDDEHHRDAQSRVSSSYQNAGVVQHRRRRADRAVWPRGVRADSTAEDRWPQAAACVPREAVAESRVRT